MMNIVETERQYIQILVHDIHQQGPAELWRRLEVIEQCCQNMRTSVRKIPYVVKWKTPDACYMTNIFQTELEWQTFKQGLIQNNCDVILLLVYGEEVECDLDKARCEQVVAELAEEELRCDKCQRSR